MLTVRGATYTKPYCITKKSTPEGQQRGAMLMERRQMEATYDCPDASGSHGDKCDFMKKAIMRGLKDPMAYYYYAVGERITYLWKNE